MRSLMGRWLGLECRQERRRERKRWAKNRKTGPFESKGLYICIRCDKNDFRKHRFQHFQALVLKADKMIFRRFDSSIFQARLQKLNTWTPGAPISAFSNVSRCRKNQIQCQYPRLFPILVTQWPMPIPGISSSGGPPGWFVVDSFMTNQLNHPAAQAHGPGSGGRSAASPVKYLIKVINHWLFNHALIDQVIF